MDTFRTFIAIEIPHHIRRRVVEHIDHLRRELPDVRASWLREDNLHLTLKFLGDVPVTHIADVSSAVARAAQAIEPFELTLSGCGAFPPHGRPKVLWIGIESGKQTSGLPDLGTQVSGLPDLHDSIEGELASLGFPREERSFHPHLTIARLRQLGGARELSELHKTRGFDSQSFAVSEVVVFRSELLREGSKHTAIARHELSK